MKKFLPPLPHFIRPLSRIGFFFAVVTLSACQTAQQAPPFGSTPVAVPMLVENGVPTVSARINDQRQLWMIVDTGSQRCLLEADVARSAGIFSTTEQHPANTMAMGALGTEALREGKTAKLTIGAWSAHIPWLVRTNTTSHGSRRFDFNLIGSDALQQRTRGIEMDYRRRRLTFYPLSSPPLHPQSGTFVVPLRMIDGAPYVQLRSGGYTWWALVDSGSSAAIELGPEAAAALRSILQPISHHPSPIAGIGSQSTSVSTMSLPSLHLGSLDFTQAKARLVPGVNKVGSGILRHYAVSIDWQQSTMQLSH